VVHWQLFFIFTLPGVGWWDSCLSHFTPRGNNPSYILDRKLTCLQSPW